MPGVAGSRGSSVRQAEAGGGGRVGPPIRALEVAFCRNLIHRGTHIWSCRAGADHEVASGPHSPTTTRTPTPTKAKQTPPHTDAFGGEFTGGSAGSTKTPPKEHSPSPLRQSYPLPQPKATTTGCSTDTRGQRAGVPAITNRGSAEIGGARRVTLRGQFQTNHVGIAARFNTTTWSGLTDWVPKGELVGRCRPPDIVSTDAFAHPRQDIAVRADQNAGRADRGLCSPGHSKLAHRLTQNKNRLPS